MESVDIRMLTAEIERKSHIVDALRTGMRQAIVGQEHLVDSLLISLLSGGHILLEGLPGLAKTLAIKTLAQLIQADYKRIQFTPDLLPADVIGTMMYSQKHEDFQVKKGPIFSNFILADEINRAPAKVQSALLEAMQEHQVTVGEQTFKLPNPFLVMATQNPIEQEGTYPLPEAQVDRFMLKVLISYTSEREVLTRALSALATARQGALAREGSPPGRHRTVVESLNGVSALDRTVSDLLRQAGFVRDPKGMRLAVGPHGATWR